VPRHYQTLHDAYIDNLRRVYRRPHHRASSRGNPCREQLNQAFTVTRPRERVCFAPARRPNIVFHFAEVLWYLTGSDEVENIAYYAPSLRRFAADGRVLTGTAYGRRIFQNDVSGCSQWERVRRLLARDPDSKRACVQIFDANELAVEDNPDVACTLGLQFLLRAGRLHLTAYMRGNDAVRGTLCDVFSFTFLQELMARSLGVELGTYCHVVGSMHVNDADAAWVEDILAEQDSNNGSVVVHPFPAMPPGNNLEWLPAVLAFEHELRTRPASRFPPPGDDFGRLPVYWQQILVLLAIYRALRRTGETDPDLCGLLWPVYRHLLGLRWPTTEGKV
jgi:thymidylate synthase